MSLWYPCVHCTEDLKCDKYSDQRTVSFCAFGLCEEQERSNGDEFRSMSDEDLAEFLQDVAMFGGVDTNGIRPVSWLDWLKGAAKK